MQVLTTIEIDEVSGGLSLIGGMLSFVREAMKALVNQQNMYDAMGPNMAAGGLDAVAGGNLGA